MPWIAASPITTVPTVQVASVPFVTPPIVGSNQNAAKWNSNTSAVVAPSGAPIYITYSATATASAAAKATVQTAVALAATDGSAATGKVGLSLGASAVAMPVSQASLSVAVPEAAVAVARPAAPLPISVTPVMSATPVMSGAVTVVMTLNATGSVTVTRYYDGAHSSQDDLPKARLVGWWDGEQIQPVRVLGWWDGSTVRPLRDGSAG